MRRGRPSAGGRNGVKVIPRRRFREGEGISIAVDFTLKRAPKYRVASVTFVGPYKESRIRGEWEGIAKWAKSRGLRTGKWFFYEDESGRNYKFTMAIEVKGKAKSDRKVRMRTLPASSAASVTFNPDQVAPRVVYHGLSDWLRWQRKSKTVKSVRSYREVYDDNPWTSSKAWAKTEIQVLVTK